MKTAKIAAAILSLIGTGFVAGFFTHRYLAVQEINRVAQMRFAPGFEERLYKIIDADPELQKQLHPIVQGYAGRIAEDHVASRAKRKALVDSLHEEIKPLLSEEQLQKLDDFSRRFREHDKKKDKKKKDKKKKEKK